MLSGRFLSQFAPSCNYKLYLPNFAHYVLIYLFSPNIALVLSQWSDISFDVTFDFPYTLGSGKNVDLCSSFFELLYGYVLIKREIFSMFIQGLKFILVFAKCSRTVFFPRSLEYRTPLLFFAEFVELKSYMLILKLSLLIVQKIISMQIQMLPFK